MRSELDIFLEILDKKFKEELSAKTNWGRVDLVLAFERAKSKALLEHLSA